MEILAFSGSLRAASTNRAVLHAAARLAPAGMRIHLYSGLADLPHFNPDQEKALPAPVVELRARVKAADGLLISSPEYAYGVPGSLKNMLDWLVGGDEFLNKPVALFNASQRATHAYDSLCVTLRIMAGRVVDDACVTLPLIGRRMDEQAIAADPDLAPLLRDALAAFQAAIRARA